MKKEPVREKGNLPAGNVVIDKLAMDMTAGEDLEDFKRLVRSAIPFL